ncbi:multidrug effflux MFS transporter [Arthrobacter sp. zg-Y20]|uniref:multidrug effflux MFS transporter n=1 Tax=unclassified Arthrobacter TaxID=235627 RepID=UPI001D158A7E|nr:MULTISPECIES: multidrug effflux MFS transporter [unclassified Arthrobacter]MCC3275303.1 multidrug effflux MFS transporter [Arthrobacter sp. zg-Y20]MDK1315461.1 multidrug effflux MFS transporter [Arthrobacter sp. zg.Y20]WIB05878.1 multidrug effflux MFS transporter [Arthrobacter sp. zg-Y20]
MPALPGSARTTTAMTTGLLLVLALLSATGPFATDLYLPSFPQMADQLGASATGVQFTLTAFLIGMAAGQLVFGPFSDRYGRSRPLLLGSVLFVLASVVCAVAPNLPVLIAGRLFQGLFASAGVVIARAIVADLTSGPAAARTFSLLMTIGGVAPVLAPTVGGILAGSVGWRGVLWVLAGLAAAMLAGVAGVVRETRPAEKRSSGPILGGLASVLRRRRFVGYAVLFASTFGVLMGYISASPFIYQSLMGLSPAGYGVAFGINALGLVLAGFISARLARTVPPRRTVSIAVPVLLGASAVLLLLVLLDVPPLLLAVPIFLAASSVGFIMGNTTSLALAEAGFAAGSGSAVLGSGQFLFGAMVSPLTGIAGEDTALPLALVMCGSGLVALLALLATRAPSSAPDLSRNGNRA